MSACYPKVFVDHTSSLPRRHRSSSWALCSVRLILFLKLTSWMIFFREEAIFASGISKFGNWCPRIDRDVLKSSSETTISTSLIHNIASVGKLEQEHTSVLKLVSNSGTEKDQGIYRNTFLTLDSWLFNHVILRISSFCMIGGLQIKKLSVFLSNSSTLAMDLPSFRETGSPDVAVRPLAYTSPEEDAVGSSGADGFSKNVSWCTKWVLCIRLRARMAARLSKRTRNNSRMTWNVG